MWWETRNKQTLVVFTFNKCMSCITIGSYSGDDDCTVLILEFSGTWNWDSSSFDSEIIDCSWVLNSECDISDTVTMLNQMMIHFLIGVLLIHWAEYKDSSICVLDCMIGDSSLSSFESLIGEIVESKSTSVEWCSLFGVTDPECDMI